MIYKAPKSQKESGRIIIPHNYSGGKEGCIPHRLFRQWSGRRGRIAHFVSLKCHRNRRRLARCNSCTTVVVVAVILAITAGRIGRE